MEISGLKGGSDAGVVGADVIKDTSTKDFVADVIEASQEVPVIVDFWAPWCGPCKQLTPVLEQTVRAANGAVRLVKLNIDEHPGIAGQMNVRSIPAVFAFHQGRPVDGFMGAVPESQVKAFVERFAGAGAAADAKTVAEAADAALEAGDINGAAQAFAALLQDDAGNVDAIAGLAKCYIRSGDLARAEETLALAPPDKAGAGAIESAQAMLDLARKSEGAGDAAALQARIAQNPNDFEAHYDLAVALNAQGDRDGAADALLAILGRDLGWNDGAARTLLLQFFEAWGASDPATVKGRQNLSSLLFA